MWPHVDDVYRLHLDSALSCYVIWERRVSRKHGVYFVYVLGMCVSVCHRTFLSVGRCPNVIFAGLLCAGGGFGLKVAFRAKSSTNPAGRGQGLVFQRGDLERKDDKTPEFSQNLDFSDYYSSVSWAQLET